MKPAVKELWLAALRSGDYKQGQGRLRNPDNQKFCCLGVLCNVHAQEFPLLAAKQKDASQYMGANAFPPATVDKWSGLHPTQTFELKRSVKGRKYPYDQFMKGSHTTLARLNDGGCNFTQIATIIQEHF